MSDAFHGSHFIGADLSKESAVTYGVADRTTGENLPGRFHEATSHEIQRAVHLADKALMENGVQSPEARADLLDRMADEIEALGDRLIHRVVAETGLGEGRVRGERGRTTAQLRLFGELVREGSWVDARIDIGRPDREPSAKPDVRRMLIPLGPIAVFGASNFPLAFSVAGGDTASALAAGCPVVVKAHPAHPGTSELVASALRAAVESAGFHPGTFSMVHGSRPETSIELVCQEPLRAVGFTGSLRAGRAIFDAASARPEPIPVFAEMGSVNPVFVLPGALAERREAVAEGLAASVTLGAGQFCTKPGLVFAPDGGALNEFIEALAERLSATPPFIMLHDGIRDAYLDGLKAIGRVEGIGEAGRSEDGAAVFTVAADTYHREQRLHEEIFGPSTLVVRCGTPGEMEHIAASLEGNLTATVHGTEQDLRAAEGLIGVLRRKVGRIIFNGFPTGVEVCHSMHHGGPYPATTDARSTSVGTAAIYRFARPICYQDFPQSELPPELRDRNQRRIWRTVDGEVTRGDAALE